eukprot:15472289-Alexandrium_andersonii.AAC.1
MHALITPLRMPIPDVQFDCKVLGSLSLADVETDGTWGQGKCCSIMCACCRPTDISPILGR